jgi:hypothetical protein
MGARISCIWTDSSCSRLLFISHELVAHYITWLVIKLYFSQYSRNVILHTVRCSRACSRVRVWKCHQRFGTNSVPVFRVLLFCTRWSVALLVSDFLSLTRLSAYGNVMWFCRHESLRTHNTLDTPLKMENLEGDLGVFWIICVTNLERITRINLSQLRVVSTRFICWEWKISRCVEDLRVYVTWLVAIRSVGVKSVPRIHELSAHVHVHDTMWETSFHFLMFVDKESLRRA